MIMGNTGIDALKSTANDKYEILRWKGNGRLILLIAHRKENLWEPMRQMFVQYEESWRNLRMSR